MSDAVTWAAYRFVDALQKYSEINARITDFYTEGGDIDDDISVELDEEWDVVADEYRDSKDNLIATVNVERGGVNLG